MWPFLVFFAGGALACRYLYQFDDLADIIDDVYPDDFLPLALKDLGFEQYPTKLFVALLPNAIVLVLSVFQLRMFNGQHWTKVTTRHTTRHTTHGTTRHTAVGNSPLLSTGRRWAR
jgi:hypothetical protein